MRRMAKAPVRASTPKMGPAILASGYLAKRTRAMGRWKKRWWQLTDDGTLLYFKSEERTQALGEIDVARSCYDVKLGAEHCRVEFPRAVPPCCCFSFSVLKRTYYLYAATASDAKRWSESIANVSAVLNYRKKGSHRPAPGAPSEEAPKNRAPVRGQNQVNGKRCYSMPSRPSRPATGLSAASESEATDQPTALPRIVKRTSRHNIYSIGRSPGNRFGSVPNLYGPPGHLRASANSRPHYSTNSRLWLDGSPPPDARMGRRRKLPERDPRGRRTVSASQPVPLNSSYNYNGSLEKLHLSQPAMNDGRASYRSLQLHARPAEHEMQTGLPVDMDGYDLPPRAQSVDISTLSEKRARFSMQPQQVGVPMLPFLSDRMDSLSRAGISKPKNVAPPVKPKPILKKTNPVQISDGASDLIQSPTSSSTTPPEIPPKRCSLRVSVDSMSGQRDVFLPPPPNFKPPPPPELRSSSSSPLSVSTNDSTIAVSQTASSQTSPHNGAHSLQYRAQDRKCNYLQLVSTWAILAISGDV